MLKAGASVRLKLPENPRLDGALALIETMEPWGAHVLCGAAASGRFRALHSEMEAASQDTMDATGSICSFCGGLRMVRSGACETCLDCGTSGGCG